VSVWDDVEFAKVVGRYKGKLMAVDACAEEYRILPDSYYYLDGDGYSHLRLDKKIMYRLDENDEVFFPGTADGYIPDNLVHKSEIKRRSSDDSYFLRDIEHISSSPVLKETVGGKKIAYEPENLFRKLWPLGSKEGNRMYWEDDCPPWAEGEEGPGIGANITVEFKEPVSAISLLNGYVNLKKKYLYRQNNRVKTMKVIDMDNNKEYLMEFEDKVYFETLFFPYKPKKIKLIIESVYAGTKYDDTCITEIVYHPESDWYRASPDRSHWSMYERTFGTVLEEYKRVEVFSNTFHWLR
jgi:hypothetical protein